MRQATPALVLAWGLAGVALMGAPEPPQAPADPVSSFPPRVVPWHGLDEHASWAAVSLAAAVPYKDWPYVRFISWNGVPQKDLDDYKKVFAFWVNQMSFSQLVAPPYDVPGTAGRLQWVDIRSFRWNTAAWQTVAERDPYCREEQGIGTGSPTFLLNVPGLQTEAKEIAKHAPTVAEFLRLAIGTKQNADLARKDVYPLVALVWGPWLFRETIETLRSTSYYDLLYADRRFIVKKGHGKKVTKTIEWKGGDFTWPADSEHPGQVTRSLKPGTFQYDAYEGGKDDVTFKDFPADEREWEQAFGIDVVKQFGKDQKIDLDYGAVVEGGHDAPGRGSIVSLHNRLVITVPIPTGAAMKTFDVKETAGKRDFLEEAPKLPFGEITFDAGELLAYLPNGGLAAFLADAKGKRLEVADNQFAKNTAEDGKLDPLAPKMDARVKVPGSCVDCHAGSGGFILPRNLMEEVYKVPDFLKFIAKDKRDRVEAFYIGWESRIEAYQRPYQALVKKTTGWDGATLAVKFQAFRDWYDKPVDCDQAAAEVGLEVGAFKAMVLKSPKARLNRLVLGKDMPRRAWEQDAFREAGLFLSIQQR